MALDIIPASSKEMRLKIIKNIGIAFVKLGQFHEAIESFETIMKGGADFQTAFNLVLCLYALGDVEKIKQCFIAMLSIEIPGLTQNDDDDLKLLGSLGESSPQDQLNEEIKEKKRVAVKYITDAAKLIAGIIEEDDVIAGYFFNSDINGSSIASNKAKTSPKLKAKSKSARLYPTSSEKALITPLKL